MKEGVHLGIVGIWELTEMVRLGGIENQFSHKN
jgi:hypothetical protein